MSLKIGKELRVGSGGDLLLLLLLLLLLMLMMLAHEVGERIELMRGLGCGHPRIQPGGQVHRSCYRIAVMVIMMRVVRVDVMLRGLLE